VFRLILIRHIIMQMRSRSFIILTLFILSVSLFFLIAPGGRPGFADTVKKPIEKNRFVPANLLEWGATGPEYAVLVDKSMQKVMLYQKDDLFSPEKIYDCSTGENDGPKSKRNDRKTPEGIYFFTNSYTERFLAPIYGSLALPINYPNVVDKKAGRGGYGIWFHGTNKPLKPRDTNGCIVLDNGDIEDLASRVRLFDTPVIISPSIEMVEPAEVRKEAVELKEIIENWRRAWQEKDIEEYMSFYNRRFTSGQKGWKEWKEYKTRLAKQYKRINVEIEDLSVLSNEETVLAIFTQTYRTPGFESLGRKRLYFTKNSDQWRIIGEDFRPEKKGRIPLKKPTLFSMKDIEDFIDSWKGAWQGKDLEEYISFYAKGFRSRGMDLEAWREHRHRLNEKYLSLEIGISDLKIKRISDRSCKVSFLQDYRADGYEDLGIKEMILVKKGKDWKIKSETWTPVKKNSRH